MTGEALPRIEITEMYGRLNQGLIDLVEYIPDDKLEWSPREELWDFHHILAHVVFARHNWMGNSISQKIKPEQLHGAMATKVGMGAITAVSVRRGEPGSRVHRRS